MFIEQQSNRSWDDIKASLKNGPVKTIPPPPGYIPPKRKQAELKRRYHLKTITPSNDIL